MPSRCPGAACSDASIRPECVATRCPTMRTKLATSSDAGKGLAVHPRNKLPICGLLFPLSTRTSREMNDGKRTPLISSPKPPALDRQIQAGSAAALRITTTLSRRNPERFTELLKQIDERTTHKPTRGSDELNWQIRLPSNPRRYSIHDPKPTAFAMSFCGNIDNADDLVQETLVQALADINSFEPGTNHQGWLFTILRNLFDQSSASVT